MPSSRKIVRAKIKGRLEVLVKALGHREEAVRREAIAALVEMQDQRTVEPVVAVAQGADQQTARAALDVLFGWVTANEDVRPAAVAALFGWSVLGRRELREQVKRRTDLSVIVEGLRHTDPTVRERAASILAEPLGDLTDKAFDLVVPILPALDEDVRTPALAALLGHAYIQPAREALASYVAHTGDFAPIVDGLVEKYGSLERNARGVLKTLGSEAVPALIAGLSHPQSNVRRNAVLSLEEIGDARAVGPLVEILEQELDSPPTEGTDRLGGSRSGPSASYATTGRSMSSCGRSNGKSTQPIRIGSRTGSRPHMRWSGSRGMASPTCSFRS